jgi:hypothetical protein
MIGFIIKKNYIKNLIKDIEHYHRTSIPLIDWTINEHNNFESALSKSVEIKDKKKKFKYISEIVGSKSITECAKHFKYCKQILLNRIETNEIVWIDYNQYLNDKKILKIFKKYFFIETVDSFDLINANDNKIYIINNADNLINNIDIIPYFGSKQIIISNKNYTWWINMVIFANFYRKKYNKTNELMESLLWDGYIDNNYLDFKPNKTSKRCFEILVLNSISKLYNVCKEQKYKKLNNMLSILNLDFEITNEHHNIPYDELFETIMIKWLPFNKKILEMY